MDKPNDIPTNSPGYETRDANVRGVYNFLIFMAVVLVAVGLVSWGMFRLFAAQDRAEDKDDRNASPFAETRQVPMGPRLQVTPREDWLKYREEQDRNLKNLSWGNRATGIVNVPIEQAMDILVKKGLPVQGAVPPADAAKPAAPAAPAAQGTKKP
jgi:hypothetical protein